jgi:hypothetical protein
MAAMFSRNSTFDSSRNLSWRGLLEFEKSLFVAANLLDVVMTLLLLETGAFCESNPIADFFLEGWGILGMAGYKLVLVGLVLLIANVVAIWRIETSRKLLNFGSLTIGAVVTYSMILLLNFHAT